MSYETQNGGRAFPCPGTSVRYADGSIGERDAEGGMSLRDYFAAKAMQTLISSKIMGVHQAINPGYFQRLAILAYTAADAMIARKTEIEP